MQTWCVHCCIERTCTLASVCTIPCLDECMSVISKHQFSMRGDAMLQEGSTDAGAYLIMPNTEIGKVQ